MTPSTKETLLTILFLILAIFLAATILFSLTGCATHDAVRHASESNPSILHAAEISDRIDGKSVIIEEWLKSH